MARAGVALVAWFILAPLPGCGGGTPASPDGGWAGADGGSFDEGDAGPSPDASIDAGFGGGLVLLGRYASACTGVPFPIDGHDVGARVGISLGAYSETFAPELGRAREAEFSEEAGGAITVRFHPTTRYRSTQGGWFDNRYFLYVGAMAPPNAIPDGCGFAGTLPFPAARHLHFAGEIEFVSAESAPPPGSGPGNILLGGWLAFDWPDTTRMVVGVNDFGGGSSPPTLASASYECDAPAGRDWWHNLSWQDWWSSSLADTWISFDIDLTEAALTALSKSGPGGCGTDLSTAGRLSLAGAFVGPEYAVEEGGQTTFRLRSLRLETR